MKNEFRNISKDIVKWDVIKGVGRGGCVGIMIYARASKPTNKKADDSTNNSGIKPEWWLGEMFAAYYNIDNGCNEKGKWRDGGGCAKDEPGDEHNYSKEERILGCSWVSNKMEIRGAKKKCNKGKGDVIMNHRKFVIEGTSEGGDNKSGEETAKNQGIF